jgi:carbamoyltransferase
MKREIILGISGLERSPAAALMIDGAIIAAAEEERFSRLKNASGFPFRAAQFCLSHARIRLDEVTNIAFGKSLSRVLQEDASLEYSTGKEYRSWPQFARLFDGSANNVTIDCVPHQLAHAASAFSLCPGESAAFLTVDHYGESKPIAAGYITPRQCRTYFSSGYPDSLAMVYAAVTGYLGFRPLSDEYRVMGLAAYGMPSFMGTMNDIVKLKDNGTIEINTEYFIFPGSGNRVPLASDKFIAAFGAPRDPRCGINKIHKDIASSLQHVMRRALIHLARHLKKLTDLDTLCYSGDLALNCDCNTALAETGLFKNIYIHPASHDAGTAVGACWYSDRILKGNKRKHDTSSPVYLGSEFSCENIAQLIDPFIFDFQELNEQVLISECAYALASGKVAGWFQGRAEWGPRALGNRSILADPRQSGVAGRVNEKIKFREPFRPFAPSVLIEDARDYFEFPEGIDMSSMLFLAKAKAIAGENAPAVVHVDGTCRVQTVSFGQNPLYWRLLSKFKEITGVPVLLNTSFNVNGEPIVNTPQEALRCFSSSNLDVLYIGNFRVTKVRAAPLEKAGTLQNKEVALSR